MVGPLEGKINNLFFYKVNDTILLNRNADGFTIEATIVQKIPGSGKRPSLVKINSTVALDMFGETHKGKDGEYVTPRKTAWISTKEWCVAALVNRPKGDK